MSKRRIFFDAVSTLYRYRDADALHHCITETEDLIAQIRYQQQLQAPFWTIFLRADGTIVQIDRNYACYFGHLPAEMVGQPIRRYVRTPLYARVANLIDGVLDIGQTATDVFPGRCGGQMGVVACPVPWPELGMGDLVGLIWPLGCREGWFRFAFRSFDGLRAVKVLDDQGRILAVSPECAAHLGTSPDAVLGESMYDHLPPAVARHRRERMQETVWTACPGDWVDRVGSSEFDIYKIPFLDPLGGVDRVLLLARDRSPVPVAAPSRPLSVHLIE